MNNQRRRKKRHTHGNKTVDVCRGKNGYGFTISGQQPCILSCIVAGSPADRCGLKTGDYLLAVNNLNVSKASHDEVVRLIGSSSGTLTLVIAENYNDSDSSDDDYQNRPKNKYPNRVRLRQNPGKNERDCGFGKERSGGNRGRNAGSIQPGKRQNPSLRTCGLSPVNERYGRGVTVNYQQSKHSGCGVENIDPLSVAVYPRRQKHHSAGPGSARQSQGTKHTIITREMRMVKSQSNPENLANCFPAEQDNAMRVMHQQAQQPILGPSSMTAQDLSNIFYPSIHPHIDYSAASEQADCNEPTDPNQINIRIIVGYVGSVEMPRDALLECSRLQSIRSAVRRLHVDHRVHTLVLMDIYVGGIRLTNTLGSIAAIYSAERIALCGTYPDDVRFFGIVTLHSDDIEGEKHEEAIAGSSCHVFMVDPDMAVHSVHDQKAKNFAIQCTMNPKTKHCQEFPQSASQVVKQICKLFSHRNGFVLETEAEEHGANQNGLRNRESNSSNSDSGLGFREDHGASGDGVYVVEMAGTSHLLHQTASSSQDSSLNWTSERSAFLPTDGSMYKSNGDSDLSTMMPSGFRYARSGTSDPGSNASILNSSSSSNDISLQSYGRNMSAFDRLNLRVMPDPAGISQINTKKPPQDSLDKQSSADNLRRSMHRYLQSAAQQKVMDYSGSDADSLRSCESNGSGGAVHRQKSNIRSMGVSTISDAPDLHKLSPRVFQPSKYQGATPSLSQPEFLVPAVPVLSKPPVPERKQMQPPKPYDDQMTNTPMRNRPLPERPKSTPPIHGHVSFMESDSPEDYDSDPGSVRDVVVTDDEWNGSIKEPSGKESSQSKKSKRRFSEGFFLKKLREKDVENSRLSKGGSFKQIKIKRRPTLSNSHEAWCDQDRIACVERQTSEDFSLFHVIHVEKEVASSPGASAKPVWRCPYEERCDMVAMEMMVVVAMPVKGTPDIPQCHNGETGKEQDTGANALRSFSHRWNSFASRRAAALPERPSRRRSRKDLQELLQQEEQPQEEGSMTSRRSPTVKLKVFVSRGSSVGRMQGSRLKWQPSTPVLLPSQQRWPRSPRKYSIKSLVVPDVADFPQNKLNGAPSVTSVLHVNDGETTENGGAQFGRSAGWAIGLERLLADCAGLATFTEFLKKEYSQENIDFWVKCERYKNIEDAEERKKEAHNLWNQHVSPTSSESVNLDAATQAGVEKGVDTAAPDLFHGAQTHIFWLMKQDSYPRFLKSELYKLCYKAEIEGNPLPFSGVSPEEEIKQREDKKHPGMKKSKSTVSDSKRRQSIFAMWKNRSDKRMHKVPTDPDMQQTWARQEGTVRAGAGSLDLVDLNVISKEIKGLPREDEGNDENGNKDVKFFRVTMPDGSTTVVKAKPGTPIKEALSKLCERRTLTFAALEVTLIGQEKPVDVTRDMVTLASKEIRMETRALFQVDLSTRRTLVVRAKPNDSLRATLKPILPKYNYKSENIVAHLVGSGISVDVEAPVTNLEGQRIIVQTVEDFAEWGAWGSHRGKPPLAPRSRSTASLDNGETEDDLSQLVKEIKEGGSDVAHLFDESGVYDPDKKHDDKRNEESRTSGIFSFIRRNSVGEKDSKLPKHKKPTTEQQVVNSATFSGSDVRNRRVGSIKDRDAENLIERLTRALDRRIDDQRGISKDGYELPDFLKVDRFKRRPSEEADDCGSVSSRRERRNSESSILDFEPSQRLSSRSLSQESINTKMTSGIASPVSGKIPYMDQSFSQDGIVPNLAEAELAFNSARHFPGSPNLDMSWQSNVSMEPAPQTLEPLSNRLLGARPSGHNPQVPPRRTLRPPNPEVRPRPRQSNKVGKNGESEHCARPMSPRQTLPPAPSRVGRVTQENFVDSPFPSNPAMDHQRGEAPSPPARKPRKPAPLPPPRKTLSTPKKFPNPLQNTNLPGRYSHSHQNSTSSEHSHQSDSTSTTNQSGLGGSGGSPVSTPSPTTHDLVLDEVSSPDSPMSVSSPPRNRPRPPPRPSKRTTAGSGGSSADESSNGAKKTLNFEQKDNSQQQIAKPDMQVSYV